MENQIRRLRLENISFGYDSRHLVFENLNFSIPEEPLVWLHGPAGQGKSSLLKILAGLVIPQGGHYFINDIDVLDLSFREFLPYRLRIGYAFETGGLLSNRSLYDNLMLPLMFHKLCSHDEADARVMRWLKRFDLVKVKDQRPFAVAGSQRKATVLLRAFIHQPEIALLDDALTGLKQQGVEAFQELLQVSMEDFGLKHILFCSEDELRLSGRMVQKIDLFKAQKVGKAA